MRKLTVKYQGDYSILNIPIDNGKTLDPKGGKEERVLLLLVNTISQSLTFLIFSFFLSFFPTYYTNNKQSLVP